MDLLINMENSAEALRLNTVSPSNAQSTDFLQLYGCFDPSNSSDMASSKADFRYIYMQPFVVSGLYIYIYIYIYMYVCMYEIKKHELIFYFRYAWVSSKHIYTFAQISYIHV
jgi:hypothetical protein